MAVAVYHDNNDLCKNNYYYALSSDCNQNPPTSTQLQTGIANSGASGFYFAPGAPVANYNPAAPKVGVRVANGCSKSLMASATLASVPSLPQDSMVGHVMPTFPTPSSDWAHLPTKTAPLSSTRQLSWSTTLQGIPS
jgi:hypothetical protein